MTTTKTRFHVGRALAALTLVLSSVALVGAGPAGATVTPAVWAGCSGGLVATVTGTLRDPALKEVSGVVAARRSPGIWWMHNDSGDSARLFAVADDGRTVGEFALAGVRARDWEDIATGPGPVPGTRYLYVGDIGDNNAVRPSVQVLRVPEPEVSTAGGVARRTLDGVATLNLVYPDGARNAEALLVDPRTGVLLVVTKSYGGTAEVYRAPAGLTAGSTTRLTRVATFAPGIVTGADVTPDGAVVAIRTYSGVRLYQRPAGSALERAFGGRSCTAQSAAEPQGEAIGFTADGRGYVTVSEGAGAPLRRFAPRPG